MASSSMIVAWRSGTTSRYESQWALVHKFVHLNGAGFSEIKATFDATPKAPWNEKAANLDRLERLDSRKLAQAFEIPEPDIRLLVSETYNVGSTTCATLRYCPVCMKQGFHTAVFQLNSVVKCPLHNVDLETKCPACHFTIAYRLGSKELSVPFGCKCGAVLWSGITDHLWSRVLTTEEEIVFDRLLSWVDRFRTNDLGREFGWGSGHSNSSSQMRGLAIIEPIDRWLPQYFGVNEDDVLKAKFGGKWISKSRNNGHSFPIKATAGSVDEPSSILEDWFNANFLHIYRQHVALVMRNACELIGRHQKCAEGVGLYRNATVVKKGYCLWGIAYMKWTESLKDYQWHDSAYTYTAFSRDRLDPLSSIRFALTAIDGRAAKMGGLIKPVVLWLALQIFEARLFCDFAYFINETMDELMYCHGDAPFNRGLDKIPAMDKLNPVIAYYPGRVHRPKVKAYLGFSLQRLAEFAQSGVGCEL
jgi:hypothetical protein